MVSMWNARLPARFPDIVVEARSEADVIAAVRMARERRIGISPSDPAATAGSATFLREGGMLLDLSRMNAFSVDRRCAHRRLFSLA